MSLFLFEKAWYYEFKTYYMRLQRTDKLEFIWLS